MNTPKLPLSGFIEKDTENNSNSFGETVTKYFYYWPLFLICILVSMSIAFVYLHYAKPEYIVKAKLLIKAENKSTNSDNSLNEIVTPYQTGKNVKDEIEILKSRSIILQVVKNLGLWVDYQKKGKLVPEDLYQKSPLKFVLIQENKDFGSNDLSLTIVDQNSFLLKKKNEKDKTYLFNTTYKDKMGTWQITKNPNFNKYVGSTILINVKDPELAADKLLGRIGANEANKETSIVELSITESVLARGKDILNQLITQYNLASEKEKDRVAGTALKFIDDRLSSLTGELYTVEKEVEGFRSDRGLTDISSESKLYLDNVRTNDAHLNEVDVQLRIINGLEQYVNSDDLANSTPPSTIGISEPGLNALVSQLIDVQSQYQRLLGTLPEKNPAFDPLRQQISSTKNAIRQNIRSMKSSLVATRNKLQEFNSGFEGSIKSLPSNERQLVSIKRQQSIKENLYVYLLQKREEAALSHASNLAFSQTVDSAYLDNVKKPLTYSLALLIGFLVPASLLFGREIFNNKISSSTQILQTGAPVTSELIYEYSKSPIVFQPRNNMAIGEQFRSLRTNLIHLHGERKSGRVTLVTSSIAGEGKSFVASNLAVALAASGRKTLILEFDLRKPKIASNFNLSNGVGISDYLSDHATAEEIIKQSAHPNLSIISAGTIADNPAELLEENKIDILIDRLKLEFDDILIDSPPVFLITDAMLLSRLADTTLYIIRQNFSFKKHLEFIRKIIQEQKLPQVQVVFNAIQKRGEYKYGYEYYAASDASKKLNIHNILREVSNRLLISNN
jgi:tyrosine-protein kinase Etk/Wzc